MIGVLPLPRSVPSGRVGNAKDAIFRSNEHFREAVGERENLDVQVAALVILCHSQALHAGRNSWLTCQRMRPCLAKL